MYEEAKRIDDLTHRVRGLARAPGPSIRALALDEYSALLERDRPSEIKTVNTRSATDANYFVLEPPAAKHGTMRRRS